MDYGELTDTAICTEIAFAVANESSDGDSSIFLFAHCDASHIPLPNIVLSVQLQINDSRRTIMSIPNWRQSDWRFVTSNGVEMTGGAGWQVGYTGGSLFLKNRRTSNQIQLSYDAFGGGAGAGIPIAIDGATCDMPSAGIGPVLANGRGQLYPEDFEGLFVLGSLQYASWGEGQSVSHIFFNVPPIQWAIDLSPVGRIYGAEEAFFSQPPPLLTTARAMAFIISDSRGLEVGSVGAMYYYGYMHVV